MRGLSKPRITFSPSADVTVDVLPYDYPFGRPARFATLHPGGRFQVVEASSGEKGPFTVLADGTLGDEPLEMTLHDGDAVAATIRLHDFASQASTELSPTAGWGIPQNDVTFRLDEITGDVEIHVGWASTGIGRGWDTVGHAAGVYRNRIDVELAAE